MRRAARAVIMGCWSGESPHYTAHKGGNLAGDSQETALDPLVAVRAAHFMKKVLGRRIDRRVKRG
jgi:hypothetical protein